MRAAVLGGLIDVGTQEEGTAPGDAEAMKSATPGLFPLYGIPMPEGASIPMLPTSPTATGRFFMVATEWWPPPIAANEGPRSPSEAAPVALTGIVVAVP